MPVFASFLLVILTAAKLSAPKETQEMGGLREDSPPNKYPAGGVVQIFGFGGRVCPQAVVVITKAAIKPKVLFFSNDIL